MQSLRVILRSVGILVNRGTPIAQGVIACAYPRRDAALEALAALGVTQLVNLLEKPHAPERLTAYGFNEAHIPVTDFAAPTPEQIDEAIGVIETTRARHEVVGMHCGGGLGRTGTVLACYLVRSGLQADEAIVRIRALRPGSIETRAQVAAIVAFAATD